MSASNNTNEMLAVVAPELCDPSKYELATIAKPVVKEAKDVLIKVHATSINPIDVKKVSGAFKAIIQEKFPYPIGYDAAGTVEEVGAGVENFKIGDSVYVRIPEVDRGSWSEYVKTSEFYIAHKPKNASFNEAASIPLAGVTAFQVLKQYKGSLEGKTVFVPAGLSGTGAIACQLAKNVFKAGKVITTVSTSKVPKVPELLGEGVVDQIIDYTKEDPVQAIAPKSVDFIFDTTGDSMKFLSLMVPSTSSIISIATAPDADTLQNSDIVRTHNVTLPMMVRLFLNGADYVRKFRAGRWGTTYSYLFLKPNGEDLETLREYIEDGKVRPIVGLTVDLKDIDKVRDAAMQSYKGKGGIGKTVFEVIKS